MTLKTGPLALALIEHFEGLRTRSYLCSARVPTIGIGSTRYADGRAVKLGETIDADDARDLFALTLARNYEPGVRSAIGDAPTTPAQFGSLVSLCYNIGVGAFKRSSVARHHKGGEYAAAANAFAAWNKARVGGVLQPVAGLTRRRAAEAALYRGELDTVREMIA